jgi:class 3 adenylate cyclase/HAMP domain-containing protein
MMKTFRLGTQLNISFGLVLFVPMIIATVFSIVYYSNKIRKEAVNAIDSDLKIAHLIYRNAEKDMDIAEVYAQKKEIVVLLGLNLGQKIGIELNKTAQLDSLDMITVVDTSYNVLVRSHAPSKINEPYPRKPYIAKAFTGKSLNMTEVLDTKELTDEGFLIDSRLFPQNTKAYALTGIAPVYDRQRENIIGAIIVRRILNNKPDVISKISLHLKDRVALYEHTRPIRISESSSFVPPPPDVIKGVLDSNQPLTVMDMHEGGSISAYMPLTDFDGKPVGVLMVQTGVESYLQTRNIAIITLLSIFVIGFVLAFSIKTIIERRIVIPVQRLKEEAEKISVGEYGHSLEITSGDEIGELTESFNTMSQELQQYDRQLREHNLQLEERVKKRTAELQIANEQLISANTILEDTLEKLNPGVSRLIGNNKQQLGLVYATELVADVCNYTKLNMILGETLMGEFMRKFFRESHKLLAQYHGMFDKTVGDQIVAIFGMPKDDSPASPIHAFDAVACALKLVKAAEAINAVMQSAIQDNYTAIITRHNSLSDEDRKNIRIEELKFQCRIGINTSDPDSPREIDRMRMVMMGAETYVDYTAQGGAVIYAFRLESSGTPGHIHIGENTKRLVSQVYRLAELPSITLKGLGVQSGYRVAGYQSVFENIYPKTKFYKTYCSNTPSMLSLLMNKVRVGKIQIREVIKINEYLEVDIPYLEHLAGVYNLCMARALFAYAAAEYLHLDEKKRYAILFASLWHNVSALIPDSQSFHISDFRTQIPENTDAALIEKILTDIHQPDSQNIEAGIILAADLFDHKIFDRTYMQTRSRDVIPAKEAVALMKLEGKSDTRILSALDALMIAEEAAGSPDTHADIPVLPKDPEQLAKMIEETLSPEQRKDLISKLASDLS